MLPYITSKVVRSSRIVGGDDVEPGRYPWVVSIVDEQNIQFCGGSLITSEWVLSAAHCAGRGFSVQIGRNNLAKMDENYEQIPIVKEVMHPNFCEEKHSFDFLMIKIQWPSNFETMILARPDTKLPHGLPVTAMGWGSLFYGGPRSDVLQEVEVDVVNNTVCNDSYKSIAPITDDMLCASREGKDSCYGDSGGPLIWKGDDGYYVQVGISSWGEFCAEPAYPGVYSRVSVGIQWMTEVIRQDGQMTVKQLLRYRAKSLNLG